MRPKDLVVMVKEENDEDGEGETREARRLWVRWLAVGVRGLDQMWRRISLQHNTGLTRF